MAMDPVKQLRLTASQGAATNGITFPVLVHKVVLNSAGPATTIASALLFDAATATGTEKVRLQTDLYAAALARGMAVLDFNPPVPFDVGISTTISGSAGVTVDVYYNRP